MDKRAVNVSAFDQAFRAALDNKSFHGVRNEDDVYGSWWRATRGEPISCRADHIATASETFGASQACTIEWMTNVFEYVDPRRACDAGAIIRAVRHIVELHHGPQNWRPLRRRGFVGMAATSHGLRNGLRTSLLPDGAS